MKNPFGPWFLAEDGKVHLPEIRLPKVVGELYTALSILVKEVREMNEETSTSKTITKKSGGLGYWLDPKLPLSSPKTFNNQDLISKNSLDYGIDDEEGSYLGIGEKTAELLSLLGSNTLNLLKISLSSISQSFNYDLPKRYRETKCMRYITKLNKKSFVLNDEDRFWKLVYILNSIRNYDVALVDIGLSEIRYDRFKKEFLTIYTELLRKQFLGDEDVQNLKEMNLI